MKVTKQASIELKKALNGFETPGAGIHIYSIQGCCGTSIQMDVAVHPEPDDTVVSLEQVDFFVRNDLLDTLATVTIDYGPNGFFLSGLKRSGGCCG